MDAAVSAGFQAGAGLDPAGLKLALASLVALAMLTWVAWISMELYQDWRDGGVDGLALQSGIVRAITQTQFHFS